MHTCDSPVRRSPPARCRAALPLDLHVLGLSLAFILSQDQTLHCMCLFCYFHCPRQGFLASRKKNMPDARRCLSFLVSSVSKNLAPPRPFPPRPRTVPGPKAGAKISQFFLPIQTFLQLFCEKIRPKNPTAWKTTGNRNVFSPAGHVHPGDVLRIPATKRPPHRHARQGRAPRRVGKPGHGTHGLKISGEQPRESPWFPLRNPPTTGDGARRAPSAPAQGALRVCSWRAPRMSSFHLRVTAATKPLDWTAVMRL